VVHGRGNVIGVRDWWKKLTDETKDLVEVASFRTMVKNLAGS
jgi:hypothetical protein